MTSTDATADDGRTLLIRHALDLLNDVHPEDLSIREGARRAGLSSGAPYHHFKTKTDLLAACAVVAWTDLCEQLDAEDDGDPRHQLLRRAMAYLRYARANPGPYLLMTSRLLDDDHRFEEIVALRAQAMGGTIALITSAGEVPIDQATAKVRGIALWSMLHGHVALDVSTTEPDIDQQDLDEAVAQLATNMALLPALFDKSDR